MIQFQPYYCSDIIIRCTSPSPLSTEVPFGRQQTLDNRRRGRKETGERKKREKKKEEEKKHFIEEEERKELRAFGLGIALNSTRFALFDFDEAKDSNFLFPLEGRDVRRCNLDALPKRSRLNSCVYQDNESFTKGGERERERERELQGGEEGEGLESLQIQF